jgi:hypothetical protein
MRKFLLAATACAAPVALAQPALAAPPRQPGDPVKISDSLTIDPIIEARLRYEGVDQPHTAVLTDDASAVTLRLRAGAEFRMKRLALLVEGEGTLALDDSYNAFPFAIADSQRRPRYPVVPDGSNIDLNRIQLQYKGKAATLTLGRQRINLDDQRWVGSVGWRQNEQTFDAVRAEAKVGPVSLDGIYSVSQRSIFGIDAGPRQAYSGHFYMGSAGIKLGPVDVKGFTYLLDYDRKEAFFLANSSKTFGLRAAGAIPLSPKVKLNLMASYARQSDWRDNPFDYSADYIAAEVGSSVAGFGLVAGYEKLGADNNRAVQTPMATLHKFNGWADVFLTTPQTAAYSGLQDYYGGVSYKFEKVTFVKGLNAGVFHHRFDSDKGGVRYGSEWDAQIGFSIRQFAILAKYADYNAKGFGVDTRKIWLQAEVKY